MLQYNPCKAMCALTFRPSQSCFLSRMSHFWERSQDCMTFSKQSRLDSACNNPSGMLRNMAWVSWCVLLLSSDWHNTHWHDVLICFGQWSYRLFDILPALHVTYKGSDSSISLGTVERYCLLNSVPFTWWPISLSSSETKPSFKGHFISENIHTLHFHMSEFREDFSTDW